MVDSTLAEWILPDFTTTTIKDSTICSVLMMSTLKACAILPLCAFTSRSNRSNRYFEYFMGITCGIPTVTLEGTKADWERIVKRLDRLYELGDEPSAWANMLYPILRRFVSAFDGKPDTAFWKHVVYRQEEYCGQDDLNGWLTAFCVWTNAGKWKAGPLEPLLAIPRPNPAVVESGPLPQFVEPTPTTLTPSPTPASTSTLPTTPTRSPTRRMRLAKMITAPFRARARRHKFEDGVDQHDEAIEIPLEGTEADSDPASQSILKIGQCQYGMPRASTEI